MTEGVAAVDTEAGAAVAEIAVPPSLWSASGLPLIPLRTGSVSEWTSEDMVLDWTEQFTVHQLQLLRDFFVEGMTVNVVEEKVIIVIIGCRTLSSLSLIHI